MSQLNTDCLDNTTPVASQRERRASVRLRSSATGQCQTLSFQREADWEAFVHDISCSGIGLLLRRRFEKGTWLAIELTDSTGGKKQLPLARVAQASQRPEGNWLVGCAFETSLTEDEVQTLLGKAP